MVESAVIPIKALNIKGKPQRSMQEWLETEIWPHIPEEELGRGPLTKAEVEEILGFGPEGY